MTRSIFFLLILIYLASCSGQKKSVRNQDFDSEWKFNLQENPKRTLLAHDDEEWREVEVPHDWSVEFPYDTINGEGCVGYLPGGVGWYKKHFISTHTKNEKVYVLFDGIYNNSEIWINEEKLGKHPYGYSPFFFDLTPFLEKTGKDNVLTIKVDRSRFADSRWYPGSGIYRNVKLFTVNQIHVPIWGTYITTPKVTKERALTAVDVSVRNNTREWKKVWVTTKVYDKIGSEVGHSINEILVDTMSEAVLKQEFEIQKPKLWGVDNPYLYEAITTLSVGGKLVDEYVTKFGVRTIHFDPDTGFYLNNVNMKIKGVCLHHDGGLVGSAVPKGVWRRRLEKLKKGGCNAIRVAHNPASDELLDLCDEMGFLVQDEFFDEWDYPKDKRFNMHEREVDSITLGYTRDFQKWAEKDLKATVKAHRNHPSIFQWSIGNEIEWTYPRNKKASGFWDADASGGYFWNPARLLPDSIEARYDSLPKLKYEIGKTAKKLSAWTRQVDTTRYITANCILPSVSHVSGYAEALDVVGYSYRRVMYDYGHKHFPEKPIMGTENLAQWHEWKAIEERPFIAGTFLWTGVDYMGEAHFGKSKKKKHNIRRKGATSGLLDYAGFEKTPYYMMKSLWSDSATLHISTQKLSKSIYKEDRRLGKVIEKKPGAWKKALWSWHPVNEHWNYAEGENVVVEIISNMAEVELFLNGKSLGTKKLSDFEDRIYKWVITFTKGNLEAKGIHKNREITKLITTSSEPTSVRLTIDKTIINADGHDVAHVVAQLYDKEGNKVVTDEKTLTFKISGHLKLLGVDNGSTHNFMKYQSNTIKTNKGRCLLIVQATKETGSSSITVLNKELRKNRVKILSRSVLTKEVIRKAMPLSGKVRN